MGISVFLDLVETFRKRHSLVLEGLLSQFLCFDKFILNETFWILPAEFLVSFWILHIL